MEVHILKGEVPGPCLLSNVTAQVMRLLPMTFNITMAHPILIEFPTLFEDLGKLKDKAITFHINEAVKPVALMHRRVLIHLQAKVEEEINSLLQQNSGTGNLSNTLGVYNSCGS